MAGLAFLPLEEKHLDRVLEIENSSFPNPWSRGMFEREISLPISQFFVAQLEDALVGYGGYWRIDNEAHVVNLAVHPGYRSRGIGRQILDYLTQKIVSQKMTKILLEVRAGNRCARKLYESAGFSAVGVRPRYYLTEDAVLMEREL